jgi:hypothetical protein
VIPAFEMSPPGVLDLLKGDAKGRPHRLSKPASGTEFGYEVSKERRPVLIAQEMDQVGALGVCQLGSMLFLRELGNEAPQRDEAVLQDSPSENHFPFEGPFPCQIHRITLVKPPRDRAGLEGVQTADSATIGLLIGVARSGAEGVVQCDVRNLVEEDLFEVVLGTQQHAGGFENDDPLFGVCDSCRPRGDDCPGGLSRCELLHVGDQDDTYRAETFESQVLLYPLLQERAGTCEIGDCFSCRRRILEEKGPFFECRPGRALRGGRHPGEKDERQEATPQSIEKNVHCRH